MKIIIEIYIYLCENTSKELYRPILKFEKLLITKSKTKMECDRRKAILLVCMIAFAHSQLFSLTDFINNQDSGNLKRQITGPPNCVDWDKNGRCLECDKSYRVQGGECE